MEQASVRVDVVVLEIDQPELRIVPCESIPIAVLLDHHQLRSPIKPVRDGFVSLFDVDQQAAPLPHDLFVHGGQIVRRDVGIEQCEVVLL